MRVLLTNDDGIEADGLQALRRALLRAPRHRAGGHRARRQPLGDRRARSPRAGRCGSRRSTSATARRLRDRRHAGRLRAPRQARADRGLRGRRGRRPGINHGSNLGDDITYSGTVAAALEGVVLGLPAIAVSQQSAGARDGLPPRPRVRLQRRRAFAARVVEELDEVPLPRGHAAEHQRARPASPTGVEVTQPGQAHLPRRAQARRRARATAPSLLDLRRRPRLRRRAGHRPRRGRAGPDRGHADPLRPDRPSRAWTRSRSTTSRGCSRPPPRRSE